MPCYRKDDRAMCPIAYMGALKIFGSSCMATPTANFPAIFNGLLFQSIPWLCVQNLKFAVTCVARKKQRQNTGIADIINIANNVNLKYRYTVLLIKNWYSNDPSLRSMPPETRGTWLAYNKAHKIMPKYAYNTLVVRKSRTNFRQSLDTPTLPFLHNFECDIVRMDTVNLTAKLEVHSFTRSWYNWGVLKNFGQPLDMPMLPFLLNF